MPQHHTRKIIKRREAQTMAQTQPLPVYRAPPQNQNLTQNQQFIQPRPYHSYGYVNRRSCSSKRDLCSCFYG